MISKENMRPQFNTGILKIIAVITMFIDHLGAIFFPQYVILRYIGRIAFPIFAYCVAVGFKYTKNLKRYFFNLLIMGLITIPFYYLAFGRIRLNTMLEFAFLILVLYLLENSKGFYKVLAAIIITIFIYVVENFVSPMIGIGVEYGLYGICLGVIFYYFDVKKLNFPITMILFVLITIMYGNTIQNIAPITYLIIHFINNAEIKDIKLPKWFFYAFYPGHLCLFGIINNLI